PADARVAQVTGGRARYRPADGSAGTVPSHARMPADCASDRGRGGRRWAAGLSCVARASPQSRPTMFSPKDGPKVAVLRRWLYTCGDED
ncbi:MAG: hypothetical protein KAS81_09030, partial [Anaerolineales bacterium]|nr:hypothetical protein [Anaerolineales bacterium]